LVGNFLDLEGLAPGTGGLKGRSGPVRDIQMADEPALTTFESEDIEKRRDRYVTTESGGNRRSASRDRHREFSRISEELESLRRLVLTERGSLTQQGTVGPSRVSPRPSTLPAAAVDDSARRQAMLPTPQLDTYDGCSSLDTFLAKFENCRDYYAWNDRERPCHLRVSLEKEAGQVLWDAVKRSSVDDLIALLRSRFGSVYQCERYRAALRSLRRQKATRCSSSTRR